MSASEDRRYGSSSARPAVATSPRRRDVDVIWKSDDIAHEYEERIVRSPRSDAPTAHRAEWPGARSASGVVSRPPAALAPATGAQRPRGVDVEDHDSTRERSRHTPQRSASRRGNAAFAPPSACGTHREASHALDFAESPRRAAAGARRAPLDGRPPTAAPAVGIETLKRRDHTSRCRDDGIAVQRARSIARRFTPRARGAPPSSASSVPPRAAPEHWTSSVRGARRHRQHVDAPGAVLRSQSVGVASCVRNCGAAQSRRSACTSKVVDRRRHRRGKQKQKLTLHNRLKK